MKKQTIHHIIMGLLTLLSGYIYALSITVPISSQPLIPKLPQLNSQQEEEHALQYLNSLRQGAGLIPLKLNKTLNISAKNHANYLIINNTIGHKEEQSLTGYTGEYASNRSIKVGYHTPLLIENVSSNNHSYTESIDGLMAAIYHRFAFLDFRINEIGIAINQNQRILEKTAYVYNLGNSYLNKLCKNTPINPNKNEIQNVCANKYLKITPKAFQIALNTNDKNNSPIVVYPFHEQKNVSPVFYEELPDPLPNHSVSGFPISIAFSEKRFKEIKIQSFKLFNAQKKEIHDNIYFTQENDPNKMLKKFEFVLFPLKRLKWNHQYFVQVIYLENGIKKEKQWNFHTRKFKYPFHTVKADTTYSIQKGKKHIFYFPPLSTTDIIGSFSYPSYLNISFIDKNTIQLTANKIPKKFIKLKLGKRSLQILVKK